MSREDLESLLGSMLEESATRMEAQAEREREEKERAGRERRASLPKGHAAPAKDAPAWEDVAALARLPDGELSKVLAKAAPDDLLVVLATSGDPLRGRMLANLSVASVKWLRANLEHIEEVTNREREGAERKVLAVANALFVSGEIHLPAPEPERTGPAEPRDEELQDLLTDLVRVARESGPDALREVLASAGEPLLSEGLSLVMLGMGGDELRGALAKIRARLEEEHARRLSLMEEAVVAIADGEAPDAFRARLSGRARAS